MVNYPKVKFVISKKKELEIFLAFLNESKYRDNKREMNWAFYKSHSKLKILKQKNLSLLEKKSIVERYINVYYKGNLEKIKKGVLKTKKDWQSKEKHFFNLVDEIFKNHSWPKGQYVAYPTIWGMYPRDIKNKILWFPFKHKIKNYPVIVIAHEMLHFIFYDYFYKHYPKYKANRYNFKIWNISEAFNIVIQNSSDWIKVFKDKCKPYPEHKKLIKKMRKIWKEKLDINYLLKEVLPK